MKNLVLLEEKSGDRSSLQHLDFLYDDGELGILEARYLDDDPTGRAGKTLFDVVEVSVCTRIWASGRVVG